MRHFRADLHIHSRYSRATSTRLTPRHLAAWARVKGLDVLGSGDFTHARWRAELAEQAELDEASGLYRLKAPLDLGLELPEYADLPHAPATSLFMLQGEISSIYKRGGQVRKVHNLVYMPNFEAAERLCQKLEQVGNLASDGRPILGLDSRDLLEMVLETDPRAFLIPAHVWTPWFSVFGSKSGFNSLEECFGSLTPEIFALETGLSSDPDMNRLWSGLDRCLLVSNSDAHSGENLGREANLFSGPISYDGILRALKQRDGETRFLGTLEFFPEEGKYHLDGHRNCKVVLSPKETRELGGICPVCGKPLTVGVLHRVLELADREEPVFGPDEHFLSLIPLPEILGEIMGAGPRTKKITALHAKAVARFGSELAILQTVPTDELARFLPPLGEAVARMRRGEVVREGGYDGEYGKVTVFSEKERREMTRGALLTVPASLEAPAVALTLNGRQEAAPPVRKRSRPAPPEQVEGSAEPEKSQDGSRPAQKRPVASEPLTPPESAARDNPAQARAAEAGPGPVLVLAGPGTGKTRTLVRRVVELLDKGAAARAILAVTFTRRAASEMDERLRRALGEEAALPRTDTLHALAFELWHRTHDEAPVLLGEDSARRVFAEANAEETPQRLREAWDKISLARERREPLEPDLAQMLERYFRQKAGWNLADYTDLLEFWLEQIQTGLYSCPYTQVLVDEIQDLSPLQLELVHALIPTGQGFFGIGDPDQSIYGFRGAHGAVKEHLLALWPDLSIVALTENYRSSPRILRCASALMAGRSACGELVAGTDLPGQAQFFEAPGPDSEATWIAGQVRALLGSGSHTLDGLSAKNPDIPGAGEHSPGDIAILVRMRSLMPPIQRALTRQGILAATPEAEGFWEDKRVALIIREAGRMLGISDGGEEGFTCPDKVLARGPLGLAAFLETTAPFDILFWRSPAFKALARAFDDYGGWAGLINWVNLQTHLELVRAKSEKVQIMSLHAAKGLEFRSVFLAGLEDGVLPFAGLAMLSGQAGKDAYAPDLEEERRLFYVGITRARENLFLSASGKRLLYGKEARLKPSRFLDDLPKEDVARSALVARHKLDEQQLQLF